MVVGKGTPVDGTHEGVNDDGQGIVVGVYDEDIVTVGIDVLEVQEVELAAGLVRE